MGGQGVLPKSRQRANELLESSFPWCVQAALRGEAVPQWQLAEAILNGMGVDRDMVDGEMWKRRAAEQRGVTLNKQAASHWYRRAAEQGFAKAHEGLARRRLVVDSSAE